MWRPRRLSHVPTLRPHELLRRRRYRRNVLPALSASISFVAEDGALPDHSESLLIQWIEQVITARGGKAGELTYIFCSDDYLHKVNVEYLDHDTLTDIITFPYAEFPEVSGDLFISTDRVVENADEFGEAYHDELHRVMIHGVLHLCGLGDKTDTDATTMREQEQWALSLRTPALRAAAGTQVQ